MIANYNNFSNFKFPIDHPLTLEYRGYKVYLIESYLLYCCAHVNTQQW